MIHYAVIEIGSFAVRMIVGKSNGSSKILVEQRWSSHLRLGEKVFKKGLVPERTIQQLQHILKKLLAELQAYPGTQLNVYGTCALRDAGNREEVIQRLGESVGQLPILLSGKEEAQSILQGLRVFLPFSCKTEVVVDLGGGSLEVSIIRAGKVELQQSLDLGTLRLRQVAEKTKQREELLARTKQQLLKMAENFFTTPDNETDLVLTGGNAKTLARMLPQISSNFEGEKGQWVVFDWKVFGNVKQIFQNQSLEDLMKSWNFSRQQAEVFNTALEVFQVLGSTFYSSRIKIPFMGLKEALLFEMATACFPIQQTTNPISFVLPCRDEPVEVPLSEYL